MNLLRIFPTTVSALAVTVALALAIACNSSSSDDKDFDSSKFDSSKSGENATAPLADSDVAAAAAAPPALPLLNANIPFNITVTTKPPTLNSLQHDFDVFSWQTFVAISWPVLPNGAPDLEQRPGQNGDGATVWEHWREASTIFLPNGVRPKSWGEPVEPPNSLPVACHDQFTRGMRVLTQVGKTPGLLSESVQPFNTGPLIDQNGRYARFEILVNESMFNTIFNQKLYSKQAQQSVTSIVFDCSDDATSQVGAIMVKAAWKVLSSPEAESGRFHTVAAVIYTPASDDPRIEEKCERAVVGLVGLHIAHKTGGEPQWVWSTFEQVDNCPTDGEAANRTTYNFFNKDDPTAPINAPPPRPWDPTRTEPPNRRPQIVRKIPIDAPTRELNAAWQSALRAVNPASVWQYYELVSTQWPTQPAKHCDVAASAPANMSGAPAPQFLANSTLESYIQGRVPNVSSSCIECHLNATTTAGRFSDFTYLLERAQ